MSTSLETVATGGAAMVKPDEPVYAIAKLGEGLTLKHRATVELTEDFAEHFLEYLEFSGDRPLREPHVMFLARQMDGGTFRWEQVNLITCVCKELNNRTYRMNGQHTCWARHYAKLPRGARTPVQVLKYEAETEQDMRQLYATIDRGAARTRSNVVVAYLSGREEFPDYSKALLRMLSQGLSTWRWELIEKRQLHTADEAACLLLTENHKTALAVGEFLKTSETKDVKHLHRQPVVGAMFATFARLPQVSKEFWQVVRDGVGITDKVDPRYVLRNWLMTTTLAVKSIHPDVRSVPGETMYRGCLHAWNFWRAGKPAKSFQPGKLQARPEVK